MEDKLFVSRLFLLSRLFSNLAMAIFDSCIILLFLNNIVDFKNFGLFIFAIMVPCILAYPLVTRFINRRNMKKFLVFYTISTIIILFTLINNFDIDNITMLKLGTFTALIKLFTLHHEIVSTFMLKEISDNKSRCVFFSKIVTALAYLITFSITYYALDKYRIVDACYMAIILLLVSLIIVLTIKDNTSKMIEKKVDFIKDIKELFGYMHTYGKDDVYKIFVQTMVLYFLYFPVFIYLLPLGVKNIGLNFKGYALVITMCIIGFLLPVLGFKSKKIGLMRIKELIVVCFLILSIVGVFTGISYYYVVDISVLTLFLVSFSILIGLVFSIARLKIQQYLHDIIDDVYFARYYVFDKFLSIIVIPLGILFYSLITEFMFVGYTLFIFGILGLGLTLTINIEERKSYDDLN